MLNNGYEQCVTEPTRGSNVLDLVLCNEPILISSINVSPPFGSSDHNSIEFRVSCYAAERPTDRESYKRYLWSQGDYESMALYLNGVRWNDLLTTNFSPNALWSAFCEVLNSAVDLFVSSTSVSSQHRSKKRRYPRHVRNLIRRKRMVWRHMRQNPHDPQIKIKYNRLSAECRLAMRRYQCWLEQRVIDSNDPGAFYRFVNSKSVYRSGVGSLIGPGGQMATSDREIADLLNNYFGSVCTVDDGFRPHIDGESCISGDSSISDIVF